MEPADCKRGLKRPLLDLKCTDYEPSANEDHGNAAEFQPKLSPQQCFVVELFCGTGGLTAMARTVFPNSFGVDHIVKNPKAKVIKLDLQKVSHQKLILGWISDCRCVWVHFGVPCGTSSRARDRPLSKKRHGPQPMRSHTFPNGLPPWALSTSNLGRLRAANRLYLFMESCIHAMPKSTIWTIENPLRSWLWKTIYYSRIAARHKTFHAQFDMCMFGGKRLKRTMIASNVDIFQSVAQQCDASHEHLRYTIQNNRFDTSLEAEYPSHFCRVLVEAVVGHLSTLHDWKQKEVLRLIKSSHQASIASGRQPTKKIPPLVPEFQFLQHISGIPFDHKLPLDSKQCLTKCIQFLFPSQAPVTVHVHSKLLRRTKKGGDSGAKISGDQQLGSDQSMSDTTVHVDCQCEEVVVADFGTRDWRGDACELVFGHYWDPLPFIEQVNRVGHPQHIFKGLQDDVATAVCANVHMSHADIVIHRAKWFAKYLRLARELEGENEAILGAMSKEAANIMKTKRLALLQRIISDEGYVDKNLAVDMSSGFSLVGTAPESGGRLPFKMVPAAISVEELTCNADKSREAVRSSTRSCGDDAMDRSLYAKTIEEVGKGWLRGPLDWDSLEPSAVVSNRFPLLQGSKLRPIDNYSLSLVNSTVTTLDQATTDNVDTICAMLIDFIDGLQSKSLDSTMLARSFDLSAAYRQLCVADDSKQFSYIAVYNPSTCEADVFAQVCLPFGSRTAVNAFIRCSRCIQWIACRCLLLPVTCYYDDFVLASRPQLANNSEACMSMLFDLLGWAYDKQGPKADTFSAEVATLGVLIDLKNSSQGYIEVSNTAKRKTDAIAMIDNVCNDETLKHKDAQVLRGRLAFAHAQLFGLSGKYVLQGISEHAYRLPFRPKMDQKLMLALGFLRERISNGGPRVVRRTVRATMVLLTDASFSSDHKGGLGGVLVDACGTIISWFEFSMSSRDVEYFMEKDQDVAIAELETLAVVIALSIWCDILFSKHLVACIDNDGARYSLIKGYSKAPSVTALVQLVANTCEECTIVPWFLRVPSASNLADAPSRSQAHPALKSYLKVDDCKLSSCFQDILRRLHSDPP